MRRMPTTKQLELIENLSKGLIKYSGDYGILISDEDEEYGVLQFPYIGKGMSIGISEENEGYSGIYSGDFSISEGIKIYDQGGGLVLTSTGDIQTNQYNEEDNKYQPNLISVFNSHFKFIGSLSINSNTIGIGIGTSYGTFRLVDEN